MNGVHDMGGMHGFGAVDVEDDAKFHADWERLVFALDKLAKAADVANIDEKRHAIERMAPDEYLRASYFERWLAALETLFVEKGVVDPDELAARAADAELALPERDDPALVAIVHEAFAAPAAFDRDPRPAQFEPGDAVRAKNRHPAGHTRCPRYVRRVEGEIEAVRGTYVLPDANAHGEECAEPLYTVRFDGRDLWGDDGDADTVCVDLWERYLEAV